MNLGDVELKWLGHDGFLIKNSRVIYIDPFNISENSEKADLILITHSHYDHCSYADIQKIIKEGTKILLTADCQSKVTRFDTLVEILIVEPGQEFNFGDLKISTLPAYNVDKSFHPKEEGWVGYVIKIKDTMIYHSGDTDIIPEMKSLGKINVALLPVSGTYVMTAKEAVAAAEMIKPEVAIPMHYGAIVGSVADANEFKKLWRGKTEILEASAASA